MRGSTPCQKNAVFGREWGLSPWLCGERWPRGLPLFARYSAALPTCITSGVRLLSRRGLLILATAHFGNVAIHASWLDPPPRLHGPRGLCGRAPKSYQRVTREFRAAVRSPVEGQLSACSRCQRTSILHRRIAGIGAKENVASTLPQCTRCLGAAKCSTPIGHLFPKECSLGNIAMTPVDAAVSPSRTLQGHSQGKALSHLPRGKPPLRPVAREQFVQEVIAADKGSTTASRVQPLRCLGQHLIVLNPSPVPELDRERCRGQQSTAHFLGVLPCYSSRSDITLMLQKNCA
mmetsp:Transcript_20054/g.51218  ORF Transcript_20054/g.51218 Transcript_20054/m.51218 type:complete len:290 (-) Transcript_20054:507-1376(-)